jgi:hypothetical protein
LGLDSQLPTHQFEAPREVPVYREEIWFRIKRDKLKPGELATTNSAEARILAYDGAGVWPTARTSAVGPGRF